MKSVEKKRVKIIVYHHWDNDNLLKGIWVCNKCHMVANALEYPKLIVKVKELKNKINKLYDGNK